MCQPANVHTSPPLWAMADIFCRSGAYTCFIVATVMVTFISSTDFSVWQETTIAAVFRARKPKGGLCKWIVPLLVSSACVRVYMPVESYWSEHLPIYGCDWLVMLWMPLLFWITLCNLLLLYLPGGTAPCFRLNTCSEITNTQQTPSEIPHSVKYTITSSHASTIVLWFVLNIWTEMQWWNVI